MEEKREASSANKDTMPKENLGQVQQDHAPTEDDVTLSPLYSNVNGNMHPVLSKQNKSTPPVYSVPDMKKKREGCELKREHSDQELVLQVREIPPENEAHTSPPLYSNVSKEMSKMQKQSYGAQQVNELLTHHSSSPLYSNVAEERVSEPTTPIYSVPDVEKKRKE